VFRDRIKREKCRELGIKLVVLPYTVPDSMIGNYINIALKDDWE